MSGAGAAAVALAAALVCVHQSPAAGPNLLRNPDAEQTAASPEHPPGWATRVDSAGRVVINAKEAHGGRQSLAIPANAAAEQRVESVAAGAYAARCWVKSSADQAVTMLLQDPGRPWAAYTCAEIKVPRDQWVLVEAFCPLDRVGNLMLTLGGVSKDFRFYHGAGVEMGAPILADDFELVRVEPNSPATSAPVCVWDTKREPGSQLDWALRDRWSAIEQPTHTFAGMPVLQARHLAGAVRPSDGGLMVYALEAGKLKPRCVILPAPEFSASRCSLVQAEGRTGVRICAAEGGGEYTAWFTPKALIQIEATRVPQFQVRDCRLRYGLLPSFAGTDLCYAPATLPNELQIPSTQWFVGLADGGGSMLVAVWETDAQAVSLGLTGAGEKRLIDAISIATDKAGFSLSLVEQPGLWNRELLQEDWLGDYTPIQWHRPFPARWMGHFFVTPGGSPTFRQPCMNYSFPVAAAKTRMWGVWFEDWNYYPFYFDGARTVAHFDKTFVPNGEALFYFLEPAAADLFSPCEILEQALGQERAAALLDFDASRLRQLTYSTPNQFVFDRPVCATTTRLSRITRQEKATLGIDLATHLFEFVREIRGRLDQYGAAFERMKTYLEAQKRAHADLGDYLNELGRMVAEAQAKSKTIYATPLTAVQQKTEAIKVRLREGKEDGFDCGELDVRNIAGAQDDLCRHYSRLVLRLVQTAARNCGDSRPKAIIAKHLWDESRMLLRQPTRWEARRTLYFFEP